MSVFHTARGVSRREQNKIHQSLEIRKAYILGNKVKRILLGCRNNLLSL